MAAVALPIAAEYTGSLARYDVIARNGVEVRTGSFWARIPAVTKVPIDGKGVLVGHCKSKGSATSGVVDFGLEFRPDQ